MGETGPYMLQQVSIPPVRPMTEYQKQLMLKLEKQQNTNTMPPETPEKRTKIDQAIHDTRLRLNKAKENIMLLSRERDVLQDTLDSLELIKGSQNYS